MKQKWFGSPILNPPGVSNMNDIPNSQFDTAELHPKLAGIDPLNRQLKPMLSYFSRFGTKYREALFLLVLLLATVLTFARLNPTRVTPASAPPEAFSGERALAHLPVVAREVHTPGSPAQARVRDYLLQQLEALS